MTQSRSAGQLGRRAVHIIFSDSSFIYRGPDKKPGTRTRTRKNSEGTALPTKSRLTRPQQPVVPSGELVLVPSQPGPSRTKKRTRALRGPLPDQTSRVHHFNDQVAHFSNEGDQSSTVIPPSLPNELGHVVSNGSLSHEQAKKSVPDLPDRHSSTSPGHQPSLVQLPQLPPLAARALLDTASSSIPSISHNNFIESPLAHPSDDAQARDTSNTQTNATWPGDQLSHPHAYQPSTPHAGQSNRQGFQPGHLHAAQPPSNTLSSYSTNPGFDPQHTTSTDASAPVSLPPASPVFTRLQHTHDPNLRPPRDPFAGLTYPRAGMAVPALGRGARSPGIDTGIGNLLNGVDEANSGSKHLDLGTVGQETQPYATEGYGSAMYESYGQLPATSNVEELTYHTPVESPYHDYLAPGRGVQNGGNYVVQAGRDYVSASDVSHRAHPDYLLDGESAQLSPVGAYTPRADTYSSVRTPAEITILPPPAGGPLGLWNERSTSSSEYDESASGTGYISEVCPSLSLTCIK